MKRSKRKYGMRLGEQIKTAGRMIEEGRDDVASNIVANLGYKMHPEIVAYFQKAIDAAERYRGDAEMLKIIGQGLVDRSLAQKGSE